LEEQKRFFEEEIGIPLKLETESGKLFPVSDKARDVRDGLLNWARKQGAEITFGVTVVGCKPMDGSGQGTGREKRERASWQVVTDLGTIECDRVIIATGGLSVPQTGSDGTGLKILEALGHTIHPTHPALTPLTLTPHRYEHLAGVSLPVTIRDGEGKRAFRTTGGFLVTHRGWSGPAALNVSHLTMAPSGLGERARERGSTSLRLVGHPHQGGLGARTLERYQARVERPQAAPPRTARGDAVPGIRGAG
ncbi:MAG TPA: NAD(P)/FAD-dependent oxidoreductase, partial [Gemmatimonadales bacterium]|nr:NAD(P)/FAD-dependent oxidoreductase [Gemmatimonadales bacterium]